MVFPDRVPKGILPNPIIRAKEKQELSDRGFLGFLKKNTCETFLLGEKYLGEIGKLDSKKLAKKITAPALILHPEKDSIVPFSEGERLFSSLNCPDRTVVKMEGDHWWWKIGRTEPDRFARAKAIKLTSSWISEH